VQLQLLPPAPPPPHPLLHYTRLFATRAEVQV